MERYLGNQFPATCLGIAAAVGLNTEFWRRSIVNPLRDGFPVCGIFAWPDLPRVRYIELSCR